MDLKITNYKNYFKITGNLTKKNMTVFNKIFEDVFETKQDLTINIEEVNSIDDTGFDAMAELYSLSKTDGRSMSVIGDGNRAVYNYFNSEARVA